MLKRNPLKRKPKKFNKEAYDEMWEFFLSVWKKREHYSEVSGKPLTRVSSLFFHHILPKSKYKELALKEDNIILLTAEEHANVHTDMYRYEEINIRREQLQRKYNIE